jgi:hypothetical protein
VTVVFHEVFWVVTGTAAPIIALAAVVSLADAGSVYFNVLAQDPRFFMRHEGFANGAIWLAWFGILNLILQAVLLTVSLVSLAEASNLVLPWLAIVAQVGGLMLLAVSSLGVVFLRRIGLLADGDKTSSE